MTSKEQPESEQPPATNPIAHMLNQLGGLINLLESKKGIPINETVAESPEIIERLNNVTAMVKEFQKLGEEIVANSGLTREEFLKRREGKSDQVPPDGKRLIDQSNEIHLQAKNLSSSYFVEEESPTSDALPSSQKSEYEKIAESKDDNFGKKRRGKFRQMGANKKWKPL